MCVARWFAITTFRKRPVTIRTYARDTFTRRGSRGVSSWGSSSRARTIGPATRCGKNDWKTANRANDAGTSSRRYVSTTYEIAMQVENEMPTGSATFAIQFVPTALSTELRTKPAYLKYASSPRSKATASASSAFRADTTVDRWIPTASRWLTTVDAASRKRNRQSHQP